MVWCVVYKVLTNVVRFAIIASPVTGIFKHRL
jgi:hypothetical protein